MREDCEGDQRSVAGSVISILAPGNRAPVSVHVLRITPTRNCMTRKNTYEHL